MNIIYNEDNKKSGNKMNKYEREIYGYENLQNKKNETK